MSFYLGLIFVNVVVFIICVAVALWSYRKGLPKAVIALNCFAALVNLAVGIINFLIMLRAT